MSDNFGLKIGIEGEKEFKNALRDINQSFKVLGSEMKLASSEFDKNDKSIAAVTARNQVLNKAIDAQKDKISGFVGSIVGGIKGLLGIKSPSAVFAEMGTNMALGIGQGFEKNMGTVEKGMENSIPTDFKDTWNELTNNAVNSWSKITVSAKDIWGKLQAFFMENWKKTSDNFSMVWKGINDFALNIWSGIKTIASTLWTALQDFFLKNFNEVKGNFETVWSAISRTADSVWQGIRTSAIGIWNAISDFYNTSWRNTKVSFEAIWYGIRDTFISIWNGLKTSAIVLFNDVVNNIKSAFNIDWWSVGRSVIDGITRGVMDTARSLARAAAEAARAALDAAKSALGISSPSKVFRDEVGLMIGAGFAEGIDKSRARLMESMQGDVVTGKFIKLNRIMQEGEIVTVSTHFANKKVLSSLAGGTNAFSSLDEDSEFLQLDVGTNLLRYDAKVNLNNLEVNVYFRPQYLGV